MQRRAYIATLGLVGLLLNPLAGFAQDARTPLVFWYSLKAPYGDQFGTMVAGYEAEHPHVAVQVRNFADAESLKAALTGPGLLPDVALVDDSWQDELIAGGKIQPIEDLMVDASSMARIVFKADTFPALFQLSLRDGKLWTMPTFATDTALVYNTQMFADKKIKKAPANWGDMVADAKLLTDLSNGIWGFQLPLGPMTSELGHLYSLMLWEMGASIIDPPDPPLSGATDAPPAPAAPVIPASPSRGATPTAPPAPGHPPAGPAGTVTPGSPPTAPAATAPAVTVTPGASPPGPAQPVPSATPPAATVTPGAPPAPSSSGPLTSGTPPAVIVSPAPSPAPSPAAVRPLPPGTAVEKSPSERLVGFLTDMVYRYKVSPVDGPDDPSKYAMFLGTPETLLAAESKGLTMMAAPFPVNKVKVEELTVYSLAVTRDARDKREAYQFANWTADFQRSVVWSTSTPYLPANKQVTLSPQYFQYLTQHPGLRVFLSEMGVGRLQPLFPHYRRIMTEVGEQLRLALAQHESTEDAVRAISDKTHYLLNMPQSDHPGPPQ